MDFWDLTVVIFRRWKISLPLLVVTIGVTAWVGLTAKPDYTMTSYVQFIPARIGPTEDALAAAARNPWNQLGLATLGQASIYATQDQGFLDSLKKNHHTDNFTLTMTYPNPIVTVEVVGKNPADARETTEMVITRLRASALSLQRQSGVLDKDVIPTQRLDQGQNLVPNGGKVKRALAAVGAAGILLTAGGTVGFDALLRRRARRREEQERDEHLESELVPPPDETMVVNDTANGRPVRNGRTLNGHNGAEGKDVPVAPKGVVIPPQTGEGKTRQLTPASTDKSAAGSSSDRTAVVKRSVKAAAKHPPASRPPAATYRSANVKRSSDDNDSNGHEVEVKASNGDAEPEPSDVRVVLQPKWMGSENGGKSQ